MDVQTFATPILVVEYPYLLSFLSFYSHLESTFDNERHVPTTTRVPALLAGEARIVAMLSAQLTPAPVTVYVLHKQPPKEVTTANAPMDGHQRTALFPSHQSSLTGMQKGTERMRRIGK